MTTTGNEKTGTSLSGQTRRDRSRSVVALSAAALVLATAALVGCGNGSPTGAAASSPDPSASSAEPSSARSAAAVPGAHDSPLPEFTNSTEITNPLFPLSITRNLAYVGEKAGTPYEVAITLTDQTKDVTVDGQTITAVVSEHRGHVDGVLIEVALDYLAQADDGSVWYMGENVDNYEGGVLANHDGTWVAGIDGARPGMLVPSDPQPGFVYYSEDIPNLQIVERDEVIATDRSVVLPNGETAEGVVEVMAYKEDGTTETKLYVPGVGLYEERTPDDFVQLATMPTG